MRRSGLVLLVLAGLCYFFSEVLALWLFGIGMLLELAGWTSLMISGSEKNDEG